MATEGFFNGLLGVGERSRCGIVRLEDAVGKEVRLAIVLRLASPLASVSSFFEQSSRCRIRFVHPRVQRLQVVMLKAQEGVEAHDIGHDSPSPVLLAQPIADLRLVQIAGSFASDAFELQPHLANDLAGELDGPHLMMRRAVGKLDQRPRIVLGERAGIVLGQVLPDFGVAGEARRNGPRPRLATEPGDTSCPGPHNP